MANITFLITRFRYLSTHNLHNILYSYWSLLPYICIRYLHGFLLVELNYNPCIGVHPIPLWPIIFWNLLYIWRNLKPKHVMWSAYVNSCSYENLKFWSFTIFLVVTKWLMLTHYFDLKHTAWTSALTHFVRHVKEEWAINRI